MPTLRSNQDTTNSPNFLLEGPAIICIKLPVITIPRPTTSIFCRKWTVQYTWNHIAGGGFHLLIPDTGNKLDLQSNCDSHHYSRML